MHAIFSYIEPFQKIKFIKRQGWLQRNLDSDSIAGHVLDTMAVVLYISRKEQIDEDKTLKMMLIHDSLMAYMDDVTPANGNYDKKVDYEKQAFEVFMAKVPEEFREEFRSLWNEFESKATKESIVAKESDKIATLLQGDKYEEETKRDILSEFLQTYANVFQTNTGKEIFEEIKNRHKNRGF